MNIIDCYDEIKTTTSGFDYPSESMNCDEVCETVTKWLDDFGWV